MRLMWIIQSALVGSVTGFSSRRYQSEVLKATNAPLKAVRKRERAFVDGAEWISLQKSMNIKKLTPVGELTIVTGTTSDTNQRVVALEAPAGAANQDTILALDSSCHIWRDSMALLPVSIKDDLAISTYIAAITGIHCAMPRGVAGCSDQIAVGSKVIVMGGSDYAQFLARGVAELGANVSLVSNTKVNLKQPNIDVLTPEMDDKPFCQYIGQFDAFIDTLGNEEGSKEITGTSAILRSENRVIDLLRAQHSCNTYLSTLTESQRIMANNGILFGPSKVKDHIKSLRGTPLREPPKRIGSSVETLLSNGITFEFQLPVRTWTLGEVWEEASWPEDSSSFSLRYGLPGIDDIQLMEEEEEEEDYRGYLISTDPLSGQTGNPFVKNIAGVNQLTREIVMQQKDCLLFLSAKYCRTCKTMVPGYNRMARQNAEKDGIVFATTDTTSEVGKQVARALDVDAVPAFVLFKEGRQFGTLSVTKLPSKKLDMAIGWLESGEEWNLQAVQALDQEENRKKND